MSTKKRAVVLLVVCAFFTGVYSSFAADLAGSKDNPFVKRFEGASIVLYKAANYDSHSFWKADKDNKLVSPPSQSRESRSG